MVLLNLYSKIKFKSFSLYEVRSTCCQSTFPDLLSVDLMSGDVLWWIHLNYIQTNIVHYVIVSVRLIDIVLDSAYVAHFFQICRLFRWSEGFDVTMVKIALQLYKCINRTLKVPNYIK